MVLKEVNIHSINEYLDSIEGIYESWGTFNHAPWFRGQPVDKELLPKLYRKTYAKTEQKMIEEFRLRAQSFYNTPEHDRLDKWLFLMQHTGLPTRLLDWTDGALIALLFSLGFLETVPDCDKKPVVWMLNPIAFNLHYSLYDFLPASWGRFVHPIDGTEAGIESPVHIQLHAAFYKCPDTALPVALLPQHIHQRVSAQRSCFTVHGFKKQGIDALANEFIDERLKSKYPDIHNNLEKQNFIGKAFNDVFLVKILIKSDPKKMLHQLKRIGISYANIFPDLDHLSKEISEL